MTEAILLVACVLLAAAVVALAVAVRRQQGEAQLVLVALRAEQAAVARRLAAVEAAAGVPDGLVTGASAPSSTGGNGRAPSSSNEGEFVITRLGSAEDQDEGLERPDSRLFADLVLRESVVKAASFAHGVRRGLSPESRNRIWFEMRREVKRVRKARKAEEREAIREWKARQRASMREDDAA
jgi:hypothetical protein